MNASFRNRLDRIINESDKRAGALFNVILMIAVLLSVGVVLIDSVESIALRHGRSLRVLEWCFTLLFTLEYAVRIWVARKPAAYISSFFGVIDLLSVLPTYIALLVPGANVFLVLRALRLFRIFRILKLVHYQGEAAFILHALALSRRKIIVFIYAVLILVVILGSAIYVVESNESGFTSIPRSIYWAIVTLTTVGYGDISPQTGLGQALAAFVMLLGYSIIAVPTGIVTAEIHSAHRHYRNKLYCPACKQAGHENDARFCRRCGSALPDKPGNMQGKEF